MNKIFFLLIIGLLILNSNFAIGSVLIDRIVATVDQEAITESDLQASDSKEQALKQIIEHKIILQAAEKEGLRISPAEIEEALQDLQMRNRFATREELRQAVIGSSISWERYLADLKVQMTVMKLMRSEGASDLFVTEAEIKSFYDSNPEKFQREQVRIKQILFPISAEGEIKSGASFEELEKMAISNGGQVGELGVFKKGELSPEIDRVVFNLESGEVSDKVQTPIGFHIFKVTDKISNTVSLEQAHAEVSEFLLKEKRETQSRAWLSGIKKRAVIEIK